MFHLEYEELSCKPSYVPWSIFLEKREMFPTICSEFVSHLYDFASISIYTNNVLLPFNSLSSNYLTLKKYVSWFSQNAAYCSFLQLPSMQLCTKFQLVLLNYEKQNDQYIDLLQQNMKK